MRVDQAPEPDGYVWIVQNVFGSAGSTVVAL